ncbi:methyl-accepting chemotaxis protein [Acidiferrimicrobium sp. IK]|uniref:methyl-accepting chemotaxis protein n=1 Tax=Acidiferrimicrobium sp. IK TaxID=2871700 RepID=UPI0021CB8A69|nr:methyl-accepting chemotaxis protein [Acidiferrimicrobium sp. IK]MCU4185533.1 methyl-accepting chemotaxis protein [Acidiferrimicrobium sp. IK]
MKDLSPNWFRNRGILTRLLMAFVAVNVLTVVLGVVAFTQLASLRSSARAISDKAVAPLLVAHDASISDAQAISDGLAAQVYPALQGQLVPASAALYAKVPKDLATLKAMGLSPKVEAAVTAVGTAFDAFDQYVHPKTTAAPTAAGLQQAVAASNNLSTSLDTLVSTLKDSSATTIAGANSSYDSAVKIVIAVLVAAVLLSLALAVLVAGSVVKPLRRTVTVLKRVADGDLSARLDYNSADEIGVMAAALNQTLSHLGGVISAISGAAHQLSQTSSQFSTTSERSALSARDLASETDHAAGGVSTVAEGIYTVVTGSEEMSASIKEIATSAQEAAEIAASAVTVASDTVSTIHRLGTSSEEIGQVVKMISTIADQTNLLALNATIEAARAGDAGRGFAVVANEVKELASETGKATSDISARVSTIQADVTDAVAAVGRISSIIEQISSYQTVIASAVEEQSATTNTMGDTLRDVALRSQEVASSLGHLNSSTNDTTATAAEQEAASVTLTKMADELAGLVAQFQTGTSR